MAQKLNVIREHLAELKACRACPQMIPPVVTGNAVLSEVFLVGQAPGVKEGPLGRPFAWTAGKTLFKWFDSIGLNEENFRNRVYMAAVCRCFPGKNPKGGDRVPDLTEIEKCSEWMKAEVKILRPKLVIPVGKLAISQFLDCSSLAGIVGKSHQSKLAEIKFDIVPLPHPSGASTWHRMEPGKSLLKKALKLIAAHPSYRRLLD
jgi:uracil-DNA glycosylase